MFTKGVVAAHLGYDVTGDQDVKGSARRTPVPRDHHHVAYDKAFVGPFGQLAETFGFVGDGLEGNLVFLGRGIPGQGKAGENNGQPLEYVL